MGRPPGATWQDAKTAIGHTKLQNGHQEHTPRAEADRADAGWMRSVGPKALHG